jgi:hypothetical protein
MYRFLKNVQLDKLADLEWEEKDGERTPQRPYELRG